MVNHFNTVERNVFPQLITRSWTRCLICTNCGNSIWRMCVWMKKGNKHDNPKQHQHRGYDCNTWVSEWGASTSCTGIDGSIGRKRNSYVVRNDCEHKSQAKVTGGWVQSLFNSVEMCSNATPSKLVRRMKTTSCQFSITTTLQRLTLLRNDSRSEGMPAISFHRWLNKYFHTKGCSLWPTTVPRVWSQAL
jgi:hypothetical protein